MDLKQRKEELSHELEKQRNQYRQLGVNIERIIGAISIIDEQLGEEEESQTESQEEAK